ncbi:Protein SGT1 [Tolypocladium ophioglossoides CBS 100239]|uniref:Protein SGT1 n=1 Tax=Tolypocladium ophioglossoides (strain CBS 100239) TaxID=1163406 RepID=A0A0L0NG23_TOLOC|nr:Protein SGT1 [Tolypocladium ophioglossoides CBS 100239]
MPRGDLLAEGQGGVAPSDGFERQLSENCVEYFLFLLDEETDARKTLLQLEALRREAVQLAQTLTKDYIWQRDDFQLELETGQGLRYLHGMTSYGDAVEDEWLIVYILRELTKSHPTLWARVVDTDGEFLLVEAASVLPKWLSPEMDQNRVWIRHGNLFIIPSKDDDAQSTRSRQISLPQAVAFLASNSDALVHSSFIEAEAFYRLDKYPAQIANAAHYSIITMPRKLAFLLHSLPKSVSPAVEAFYLRDPAVLKPIMATTGPLSFSPEDLVTTSVRFSRVLFAQLKSQRFEPPARWQKALQASSSNGKAVARLQTGMKLTCGFEMLAVNADKSKTRVIREAAIMLEDLVEDGDAALPTNEEMELWEDCDRDDDETWMDINYQDFERELDGKGSRGTSKTHLGFGDSQTQASLRKIVSRFEAFLNDETAGLHGAELEDMDMDDDDDDEEENNNDDDDGDEEEQADSTNEEDSELEDKEVSFDEAAFSRMMREMMGLPAADPQPSAYTKGKNKVGVCEPVASALDEEQTRIQELSSQMEAELRQHGALKLDAPADKQPTLDRKAKAADAEGGQAHQAADEDGDDEVDIDYNLARNLLESFKSQAGMAGPTGNLLGMMGFQLPRDEDDGHDEEEEHKDTSARNARP